MDALKKAIKATKKYASKYGQSLNDKQLFLRLISANIYDFKKVEGEGEKEKLDEEWVKKMSLAQELVWRHLSKMRGIKMVGITGSVAAEMAKKGEDIDLMIITKEEELWWWRLYLRFYVWWNKIPHRKYGEKEKENEFCFNLWLDKANLKIPKEKRSLKNAIDLVMMKVVWEVDDTYQNFLKDNDWVKKYLATGYRERVNINRKIDKKINSMKKEKICYWKKNVNRILFWGQYFYIWSKTKRKQKFIKKGQAFFHEDN